MSWHVCLSRAGRNDDITCERGDRYDYFLLVDILSPSPNVKEDEQEPRAVEGCADKTSAVGGGWALQAATT